MNVLNVVSSLDAVTGGGATERTYQMTRHLADHGLGCSILTLDIGNSAKRLAALQNVRATVLPVAFRRFFVPHPRLRDVEEAVRAADVVHLITHWTPLNAIVQRIARKVGRPYVVCPAGALGATGRSRHLKVVYDAAVGRDIIRRAAGCIAITPSEIPAILEYGYPPEGIVVIPNGIESEAHRDEDPQDVRRRLGTGGQPFVLFLGRLHPIKGPDLLVEAFGRIHARFPEHHLVLAGPDEGMLESLRHAVRQAGLEARVHFVGYLGGEPKYNALRAADLVVIPSRNEAMSIVVLEAGMAGTPVLLTDRCGFDQVASVDGGRVVPATAEALANGMDRLLGEPRAMRKMGENLRVFAATEFSWDALVPKYVALYESILSSRCRAA